MGVRIKRKDEDQVLSLNPATMFLVVNEFMATYPIGDMDFMQSGYVWLYQVPIDEFTDEQCENFKAVLEESQEFAGIKESDRVSFNDLLDFDGLIFSKAAYEIGIDSDGHRVMQFLEVVRLVPEEYRTINEVGDSVLLSDDDLSEPSDSGEE